MTETFKTLHRPFPRGLLLLTLLLSHLLLLVGCGGKSADDAGTPGTPGTIANPTFTVVWPARSRDALTHGLTSALSVQITLQGASANGSSVSTVANRDAGRIGSYSATYPLGASVRTGTATFSADFYSATNAGGTAVGTAAGTVTLGGTLDLGTISTTARVASVRVMERTIPVDGGPTPLVFSATDASGAIVAVSAGSASWTRLSGAAVLALSTDGVATPASEGTATVRASVDGIQSAVASITVGASAPPSGTVRLQNGPMLVDAGTAGAAVSGSRTAQTFSFRRSDGGTETIANALVFRDIGVSDPVVILRAGSQPLQGVFTDASNRFYRTGDYDEKIPVSADGILANTVVFRRRDTTSIATLSPVIVGGLTVREFSLEENATSDQLAVFPQVYRYDLPVPGQSANLARGYVKYASSFALYRFNPYVGYQDRGSFRPSANLQTDGSAVISNASGNAELVQGAASVNLQLSAP